MNKSSPNTSPLSREKKISSNIVPTAMRFRRAGACPPPERATAGDKPPPYGFDSTRPSQTESRSRRERLVRALHFASRRLRGFCPIDLALEQEPEAGVVEIVGDVLVRVHGDVDRHLQLV